MLTIPSLGGWGRHNLTSRPAQIMKQDFVSRNNENNNNKPDGIQTSVLHTAHISGAQRADEQLWGSFIKKDGLEDGSVVEDSARTQTIWAHIFYYGILECEVTWGLQIRTSEEKKSICKLQNHHCDLTKLKTGCLRSWPRHCYNFVSFPMYLNSKLIHKQTSRPHHYVHYLLTAVERATAFPEIEGAWSP